MDLLQVKDRINLELTYSGLDDPSSCLNKKHFKDYKKLLVKYVLSNVYNRWNINLSPKQTDNLATFTVSNGSLGIIFDFDLIMNKSLFEKSDDKN